jgi:hypothetical protein
LQPLINVLDRSDENLLPIIDQMKVELLKDVPDYDTLIDLWKQSFNIRRLCVRELPIDQILERFPGYRRPELVRVNNQSLIRKFDLHSVFPFLDLS